MSNDVLLEFSMFPIGKGESLSQYVSRSLEIIDESGLEYRLNPMGTVIEGSWDQVFEVVKRCFERMSRDCDRVTVNIKADYRKGSSGSASRSRIPARALPRTGRRPSLSHSHRPTAVRPGNTGARVWDWQSPNSSQGFLAVT